MAWFAGKWKHKQYKPETFIPEFKNLAVSSNMVAISQMAIVATLIN